MSTTSTPEDSLGGHHDIQELLNYLIESNTDTPGWLVYIPVGNSTNRKKPRSDEGSSEDVPPRKQSRMHEYDDDDDDDDDDQPLVKLPGAHTATGSVSRDHELKGTEVNSLKQQVDSLKQRVERLEKIITGHHTTTTSGGIEAGHQTTPAPASQDMFHQQDKMCDHLPVHFTPSPTDAPDVPSITNDDADADTNDTTDRRSGTTPTRTYDADDDNKMNTILPSSSPAIIHRATQQFTITPLTFPSIIVPAAQSYPYPRLSVTGGKDLIVPSMILCVLANNPNIMLPLASFKTSLFDPIHAFNKENIHLTCESVFAFNGIINVTLCVIYNRIRYALHTMCSKVGIYGDRNADEMDAMARELEKGPVDVLESIVRDSMAVWNPIRVLITHLEAVTTQYSKCTTPKEQKALRRHIANRYCWMKEITIMAVMYGLYLWDSQWVSDDEWDTLAKHMTTLTTKIFPEIYSILTMDSVYNSKLSGEDRETIDYFTTILGIISCCFLHHYRPIEKTMYIPYHIVRHTDMYARISLLESDYHSALVYTKSLLKQCAVEYMEDPTAFAQCSSMANLLQNTTTMEDGSNASPRDDIMAEVERACNLHATTISYIEDGKTQVRWEPLVPMYHGDAIAVAFHITDRIVHAPPRDNPVYQKFAKIYPKEANCVTLIGYFYCLDDRDPQLQKTPTPVNRTRNSRSIP